MTRIVRALAALLMAASFSGLAASAAMAQYGGQPIAAGPPTTTTASPYSTNDLVNAGESFFGQLSGNVASVIQRAVSQYGLPNGYILGTNGGGAFIFGLRYGEGVLYTQNQGSVAVHWQGPSIGFDVGGDVSQTMMLVYNLPSVDAIYQRFYGVSGSAFVVGGIGMTVLNGNGVTLVPIVSGLGARLGINIGYLKFTQQGTGNPF